MGREKQVVFVCEHGSAKSVVAAVHFNHLAKERGLSVRAIARGTNPDAQLAPVAANGLAADGFQVTEKPTMLSESDISDSERIIAFSDLPAFATKKSIRWQNVPAVSEDYGKARDDIRKRVLQLLDELSG